jgi:hypothetical protein
MALRLSDLRSASAGFRKYASEALTETRATQLGMKTAFLCHSHKDAQYAEGLVAELRDQGWNIYIDWKDNTMPEHPNADTADKIQSRIKSLNYFLYLATPNSSSSRWCPWEIGYADGVKKRSRMFLIQTQDDNGHVYGAEYLELYQSIDRGDSGRLAAFQPGANSGTLVQNL